MTVSRTQGVVLRVCGWLAAALMALYALQVGTDLGATAVPDALKDYLYNGLLLAGAVAAFTSVMEREPALTD